MPKNPHRRMMTAMIPKKKQTVPLIFSLRAKSVMVRLIPRQSTSPVRKSVFPMAMRLLSKNIIMPTNTKRTPMVMRPIPIFWLSSRAILLFLFFWVSVLALGPCNALIRVKRQRVVLGLSRSFGKIVRRVHFTSHFTPAFVTSTRRVTLISFCSKRLII